MNKNNLQIKKIKKTSPALISKLSFLDESVIFKKKRFFYSCVGAQGEP